MNNTIYDYALMTIPLAVCFYTLSYASWLWRKEKRLGAVGVGVLALSAALYPGIVLFIIHT